MRVFWLARLTVKRSTYHVAPATHCANADAGHEISARYLFAKNISYPPHANHKWKNKYRNNNVCRVCNPTAIIIPITMGEKVVSKTPKTRKIAPFPSLLLIPFVHIINRSDVLVLPHSYQLVGEIFLSCFLDVSLCVFVVLLFVMFGVSEQVQNTISRVRDSSDGTGYGITTLHMRPRVREIRLMCGMGNISEAAWPCILFQLSQVVTNW